MCLSLTAILPMDGCDAAQSHRLPFLALAERQVCIRPPRLEADGMVMLSKNAATALMVLKLSTTMVERHTVSLLRIATAITTITHLDTWVWHGCNLAPLRASSACACRIHRTSLWWYFGEGEGIGRCQKKITCCYSRLAKGGSGKDSEGYSETRYSDQYQFLLHSAHTKSFQINVTRVDPGHFRLCWTSPQHDRQTHLMRRQ